MVAGLKAPLAATLVLVLFGGLGAGLAEVSETDFPSGSVRTDSMPRLTSRSEDYWTAVSNSLRRLNAKRYFPEGIPEETDFHDWLCSTTNEQARSIGVEAVVSTDRAGAVPFLDWMVRVHPEWENERKNAFWNIASTPPWWTTNAPPRWSPEERNAFSQFFRARFSEETNWWCRWRMDDFFCRTEPAWKTSDERLGFLERSLRLAGSESTSNPILRRIESRFEPDDVEAYERQKRMIVP